MTITTNRDNIKTMLNFISVRMMIMFCTGRAINAFQRRWGYNFASVNGVFYSPSCFSSLRMKRLVAFRSCYIAGFSFLGLLIAFYGSFTFFALSIMLIAYFAFFVFSHKDTYTTINGICQ